MWRSKALQNYFYVCEPAIEAIGVAVAREKGINIAERPETGLNTQVGGKVRLRGGDEDCGS